jgi:hypothetical protein
LRARYVQDISTFEYSGRLEELAGFFRDQRWMHMHQVLRSQGITFQELGHRGREAAIASLERQGYTGEDGAASASTEFARRGGEASIEANVAILAEEGFFEGGGIEGDRQASTQRCPGLSREAGIHRGGRDGIGIDRARS